MNYDAAVIGAGIVGVGFIARELSCLTTDSRGR